MAPFFCLIDWCEKSVSCQAELVSASQNSNFQYLTNMKNTTKQFTLKKNKSECS